MNNASQAPYALPPHRFPFRALAARAGRGTLGGERECALGCLMSARLAAAALTGTRLPTPLRIARATGARAWLGTLALPATLRTPLARVVDASAGEDPLRLAGAVRALAVAAAPWLDMPSRAELERLALSVGEEPAASEPSPQHPVP